MSDEFAKRGQSYEAKFKLDEEQRFKAEARRNKMLGVWLAAKFGLSGDAAESYANEVVMSDLDEPGIEDVIGKVMADISDRDASIEESEVRAELDRLFPIAYKEVTGGFPEPLGDDHSRVGG
ncbi:MAG: DUF1476 domain-containing protein [Rhodospirillaceae bacterium]|jgi:hypothetical protein|nr:DUF1476 domain-containing protein [Rhodospirillaceae bacterium]